MDSSGRLTRSKLPPPPSPHQKKKFYPKIYYALTKNSFSNENIFHGCVEDLITRHTLQAHLKNSYNYPKSHSFKGKNLSRLSKPFNLSPSPPKLVFSLPKKPVIHTRLKEKVPCTFQKYFLYLPKKTSYIYLKKPNFLNKNYFF